MATQTAENSSAVLRDWRQSYEGKLLADGSSTSVWKLAGEAVLPRSHTLLSAASQVALAHYAPAQLVVFGTS